MCGRFSIAHTGNRVPNAPLTWLYLPTDKKIKYVYDALNRLKEKGIVTEKDEYYSDCIRMKRAGIRNTRYTTGS